MLVSLPRTAAERRRALDWLNAEGVAHLRLFQAVQIPDRDQAQRFRAFVETLERMGA